MRRLNLSEPELLALKVFSMLFGIGWITGFLCGLIIGAVLQAITQKLG